MTAKILAWHFTAETLRDGRPIPLVGFVLRQDGEIVPCVNGLHGAMRAIDAVAFAPWEARWMCRTEHSGVVVTRAGGQIASSERKIIGKADAEPILRAFARECALSVARLWSTPHAAERYLEAGGEKLRADARAAVEDAVAHRIATRGCWRADREAAYRVEKAAMTSARAAVSDSAVGAAQSAAAWAADAVALAAVAGGTRYARDDVYTAARVAATDAQNRRLENMASHA